jgi:hypothetical protein
MGVYAQTEFYVMCESQKIAQKVFDKLLAMKQDKHGNDYAEKLEVVGKQVEGFLDSGRIQNLEYKCEQMWNEIKKIKGVKEMNCPFMSEADGMYFTNENENENN